MPKDREKDNIQIKNKILYKYLYFFVCVTNEIKAGLRKGHPFTIQIVLIPMKLWYRLPYPQHRHTWSRSLGNNRRGSKGQGQHIITFNKYCRYTDRKWQMLTPTYYFPTPNPRNPSRGKKSHINKQPPRPKCSLDLTQSTATLRTAGHTPGPSSTPKKVPKF